MERGMARKEEGKKLNIVWKIQKNTIYTKSSGTCRKSEPILGTIYSK
jgi:hypothetical protein